jgi:hypothetical protein
MSKADELAKLGRLRKQGVISETEFAAEKARLLGSGATAAVVSTPKRKSLGALLPIIAIIVLIVIAVKVLDASNKSTNSTTATTKPPQASTTTAPPFSPLGLSFAQEKAFTSSLNVGPVSWRSSPLSGGEPRSIGSDKQALLIFETIGSASDLSQVDVEAFVGSSSSAIGKDQLLALGEMAYQFGGVPASKWVGTEITASVKRNSIQSSTHRATLFGGYIVVVQTTAGEKSGQIPPTISVQVTRT